MSGLATLTAWEADILSHASQNGRFVTGEQRVIDLAGRGLLYDHGPQPLAGGAHYLVTTLRGREALSAWRAAQPKPKAPKRPRQSRQFRAWMNYCDANGRYGFAEFLKNVWPECRLWPEYR